jgi:hypothetical protein
VNCVNSENGVKIMWAGNNCQEDQPCPPTRRTPPGYFNVQERYADIRRKEEEAQAALDAFKAVEAVSRTHTNLLCVCTLCTLHSDRSIGTRASMDWRID